MRRFAALPYFRVPTSETDRTKIKTYLIAGACSLVILFALAAAGFALIHRFGQTNARAARQKEINKAVCNAVVHIDAAITQTLKVSLNNLPKIAYYKRHPVELAKQQRQTKKALKAFLPPPECNPPTGGKS